MNKKIIIILLVILGVIGGLLYLFYNKTTEKQNISDTDQKTTIDYSKYKGIWQNPIDSSVPEEKLTIKSIENNKITFDYDIYRLTSFESASAILNNNIASFDINNNIDWNIKGTIELKDNSIVFTIKESSSALLEPGSITLKQKTDNTIVQEDSNTEETDNNGNTTIYVGTKNNFKKYKTFVYDDIDPETQANMLINEIGFKLGYQIMIKEITSGKGGMTIDFDPDSAPFDLKNTYRGNGEEEYKVSGEANIANTIFDSIKETLQNYFGTSMDVYLAKDGNDIIIESANPEIIIKATEPYKGSK